MNTVIHSVAPDYEAIKTRQQVTWASGDFGGRGLVVPADCLEVVIERATGGIR